MANTEDVKTTGVSINEQPDGLKAAWSVGAKTVGIWNKVSDPIVAGAVAELGFDFACIDLQHGFAGPESLPILIQAMRGTTTRLLVRVPWNDPPSIMRALDSGAEGVIVPMVSSASEAAAAAAACRYPPLGVRSWGQMQAEALSTAESPEAANERVVCAVMIETADGLENLDEIVAVPGVDAVYIGPNDLALSLGLGRATYLTSSEMRGHIETILAKCRNAGVVAGIHCASPEMTREWADAGFQMLTGATDLELLQTAGRSVLREIEVDAH